MKNGVQYFKYSTYIVTVLAAMWFFRSCNCGGEKIKEVPVIKYDTTYIPSKVDTHYIPQPYKVNVPVPYQVLDSFTETIVQKVDTAEILKDYNSTRFYSDKQKIQYGSVTINDTITQNKIAGRGLVVDMNVPVVTKTITETQPRRNVVLFGIEALGSNQNVFEATGVDLGIMFKSQKYIGVKGQLLRGGQALIGVQLMFPVKLRK